MPLPKNLPPPPLRVGQQGTDADGKLWTVRGWMRLCTADRWWDEWHVAVGDEAATLRYDDGEFTLERPKDDPAALEEFEARQDDLALALQPDARSHTAVFARVSDLEGDAGWAVSVDDRVHRIDRAHTIAVAIGEDRRAFHQSTVKRAVVRKTFGIDATTFERALYALPKLPTDAELAARQSGTLLQNLPALAIVVGLVVGLIYLMKACG